ncbi:MAG: cation diffusion facilitator family transporter [Coxiellaceae bacterium]|nr:cation diffusion facilitator family transporter [Coxiellaceae bacterium]
MKKISSKLVIMAALLGNFLIAICKFTAAVFTSSSAMFSEGIHSVVDVGNQALLLMGLKLSKQEPDREHPFGYGKELYFWSLIVAVLLFAVGGGLSFYKGIVSWQHPTAITDITVNYIVLALAICFESAAWLVAYKGLRQQHSKLHFFRAIQRAKDPALIVVVLEDSAALIGLVIAAIGIGLSYWLHMPKLDAAASMAIGVLLFLTAIWLAAESKNLLIGEAAEPSVVKSIRDIINNDNRIMSVHNILTMHMGPNEILVNLYVDFIDRLTSSEVEAAISDIEQKIKLKVPQAEWIFIAAKSFSKRTNAS